MENEGLTSELKGQRTLATVVFTDCVGFSAKMSVNEDHTLDLIRRDLKQMKHLCQKFEGRVLKSTGDGLLMCFSSAIKAVEYAIEIQKVLAEMLVNLPPEDALQHRIGIHLADIFINQTDVMGNGVNIAARLQTLADPGGICVSQTVYDVVKAGLQLKIRYLGPQKLKNIHEVVPTYKIILHPEVEADPYAETVRQMEQASHALRIKKLLFYITRTTWESEQSRLDTVELRELLQDLLQLAPSPAHLRQALDNAVKTLSKPAEYALVANTIFKQVTTLQASLHQLKESQSDESASVELQSAELLSVEPPTGQLIPQPLVQQPANLYEQLAQELEQMTNLARIKKLIFYVCNRRWENDSSQLEHARLSDLIANLHQLAPTPERLRRLLHEFVQTLSKQTEYSLIADTITNTLKPLYVTSEGLPDQAFSSPQPFSPVELCAPALTVGNATKAGNEAKVPVNYPAIATELEQETHLARIKKLMVYVCRRQWERDPAQLNSLDLSQLIQEMHQLAPTREQLRSALNSVVGAINKREEYGAIAHIIISKLDQLYSDPLATDPLAKNSSTEPKTVPSQSIESNGLESTSVSGSKSASNPSASNPDELQDSKVSSNFNLFDSRLGIMKYTNPLRSKMLIYAALHGDFNATVQDWLNLKMVELDSLLRRLLTTCKNYTDLESLLYSSARKLRDPEENIQTATAVLHCLRPFYLHGGPANSLPSAPAETLLGLDLFEENTLEIARANDDDALTCQFLASAPTNLPPANSAPTRATNPAASPTAPLSSTPLSSTPLSSTVETPTVLASNSPLAPKPEVIHEY